MGDERTVVFSDYALMRMHQRNIDEEDVVAALDAPRSRHRRRQDGRSEAWTRVRQRTLLVIYRRQEGSFIVINAMWE